MIEGKIYWTANHAQKIRRANLDASNVEDVLTTADVVGLFAIALDLTSTATPQELLEALLQTVIDLNLQQGIENSLDAKIDAVSKALDDLNENNDIASCNTLDAFINAVEAQRGGKISEDDADTLVAAAQQILEALNCP